MCFLRGSTGGFWGKKLHSGTTTKKEIRICRLPPIFPVRFFTPHRMRSPLVLKMQNACQRESILLFLHRVRLCVTAVRFISKVELRLLSAYTSYSEPFVSLSQKVFQFMSISS